jgi:hypothetical protein
MCLPKVGQDSLSPFQMGWSYRVKIVLYLSEIELRLQLSILDTKVYKF